LPDVFPPDLLLRRRKLRASFWLMVPRKVATLKKSFTTSAKKQLLSVLPEHK
jgi:hypothetical protein